MKNLNLLFACCLLFSFSKAQLFSGKKIYEFDNNSEPRWSSFENMNGAKGAGGMENNGAKGHPADALAAGETKVLLDARGPGIVNRIWITISDRSPEILRSLKLQMFWDGEAEAAVSVPLGDFFGMGLGKTAGYHNVFFADPEGRSFQCFIPMPFKKNARIQIINESGARISHLFFDIDFQKITKWDSGYLYFHSCWNRDTATTLTKDFELLPSITGRGRFLGVNIGIITNPIYKDSWWGEGEVKIYFDGDKGYPTLVGTGSEDYIGTGWGQGEFYNDFAGCLSANKDGRGWAFYRFHIPDPVYFKTGCRVTLQQIGGDSKEKVAVLQEQHVPLIPVSFDNSKNINPLFKKGSVAQLSVRNLPDSYVNFYRSDDVSATAYFYLDRPGGAHLSNESLQIKTAKLIR